MYHPIHDDLASYDKTINMPNVDSAIRLYDIHWRSVTNPDWSRQLHTHTIFEINVVLEGTQEVLLEKTKFEMHPGDLLIVKPGVAHRVIRNRGRMTYFAFHFDFEDFAFRSLLSTHWCGLHRRNSMPERQIREPLHQFIEMLKATDNLDLSFGFRMKLLAHVFELFAAFGNIAPMEVRRTDQLIAFQMAEQIGRITKIGFKPDSPDIDISQLAKFFGYSRSYLCRLFRSVFGMSPRRYLSMVKLHQARHELLNPNQSMEQIADKLGFQDGAHFSKQFKRWTGTSPTEYRQFQQR